MDGAKCPHLDRKNSELGDVVAAAIAEFYSWTEARRSVVVLLPARACAVGGVVLVKPLLLNLNKNKRQPLVACS
jgi:hypothetical protein